MKFTGLILAAIGLLAGVFCVFVLVNPTSPNNEIPVADNAQTLRPNMVLPLAACGACVVAGGAMYLYGGRGYFISNDRRVTN